MKNVKFRGIPRQKDEFRGKNPISAAQPNFRGSKLWALVIRIGVNPGGLRGCDPQISKWRGRELLL